MTPEERKKKYPYWEKDCSMCGAPLAFGITNEGARIPLDLRAETYAIIFEKSDTRKLTVTRFGQGMSYVSHFRTCTHPDNFKKRTEEPA